MIYVRPKGGLGNQMFQYAAARSIAKLNNTKVSIQLSWFDTVKQIDGVGVRHYELSPFNIDERFFKPNIINSFWLKLVRSKVYSDEPDAYTFKPYILKARNYSIIEGFFQNEKYFVEIRDILLNEFKLKMGPSSKNKKTLNKISDTYNSVSIHVRRGDYVTSKKHNAFHGLLSKEYYQKAINLIGDQIENPVFYIFSDDPKWARTNLKLSYPANFISHNKQGIDDLNLMRHCTHHIIANSSFSWWGAWLSNNPNKIVIAPKNWIQSNEIDSSDVVPKEWLRI